MRTFMHRELEMMMDHLEHIISRPGRARTSGVQEAKHMLMRVCDDFIHSPMSDMGMGMQRQLHMLRRRIESVHTVDEIRDLLRDFRQYAFAVSSALETREMSSRIHELESQIKSLSEFSATETTLDNTEEKVLTLDKLKDKKVLFTVMPFHEDFHDVWIGGIQRAATGTGLTPVRIDMITKSSEVTDDIVSTIDLAEIVVVDVTRNNPNVMFEFGFALARKKSHVVISQSTEFLTFDIKNVRTIIYRNTWSGIEELHKNLQKFIKGTVGDKGKKK